MSEFEPHDRLDTVLRAPIEPLAAAPGSFEALSRRAANRRHRHAAVAVTAAAVIIAAVAVPVAVSLTRTTGAHYPGTVNVSTPMTRLSSTGVASDLVGFKPTSLSFAKQTEGWIAGGNGHGQVELAKTTDQGATWTRLPDVAFPADGAQVRFASPTVGFVFGKGLDITKNAGRSWTAISGGPAFISDLEIWDGRVHAIGSTCNGCSDARLYQSTLAHPTLHVVTAVPALHDAFPSLAVQNQSTYVLASTPTASTLYASHYDGSDWHTATSPCRVDQANVQVAAAGSKLIAVTCLAQPTKSSAPPGPEKLFLSSDGGQSWTRKTIKLSGPDGPQHLTIGGRSDFITNSGGGKAFAVTTNGGKVWRRTDPAQPYPAFNTTLNFVGFIDTNIAVGLITPTFQHPRGSVAEFVLSRDDGRSWQVTNFG